MGENREMEKCGCLLLMALGLQILTPEGIDPQTGHVPSLPQSHENMNREMRRLRNQRIIAPRLAQQLDYLMARALTWMP